ncbi:bifunctional lysylphosphatidylglycerol flippase/synthetase MprF [Paenarthrobacter nicotinovorans]|uniref:bifunctional lysylphosphatidylglycerol flippase/synthetase MprF n=1 Tax=Paenarthrobacter nicotinovorans TaxID=29320 RepID=UPI00119FF738|nr:rhomboid family intramembrane serine protease [Paenarthrobacter nicotinovorans]
MTGSRRGLHPRQWSALLARAPVTLGFVAVFWGAGALSSSLVSGPEGSLRSHVAATAHSIPGQWWTLLASAFWAGNLAGYVLATIVVLAVGVPLERRMGSLRFGASALGVQVLGVGAAVGFVAAARAVMGGWTREMGGHHFLGPSAFIAGTAIAATTAMPTLWRRRIRLVVFALLLLLALYGGGFADLVRLAAAGAGALLGPVMLRRRTHFGRPVTSRHEGRVLIALLVAVTAIGPVVAGLVPHAAGPLSVLRLLFTNIQPVDPLELQSLCSDPAQAKHCAAAQLQLRAGAGGIFMAILPSFLLLLLADGLRRGRRFAWAAAVLIQLSLSVLAGITINGVLQPAAPDTRAAEGISTIGTAGSAYPLPWLLPLLLPAALTLVLLMTRKLFPVAAPAGTYRSLGLRLAGTAVALGVVYVGAGLALAQDFSPVPGPAELLTDVPDRFLPLAYTLDVPPAFFPQGMAAVLLYEGVGVIFWAASGVLVLKSFLRPAAVHHRGAEGARSILIKQGGGSLSWMTTWTGNTYWFSATGESFIAYRVISGIALTLGGPVGPESGKGTALSEFARFCREHGWTPCFYSVDQELRDHAASLGWASVQVAQETVLSLDSVSFKGKKFQDIRTAMNNAAKVGIRAEWITYTTAPLPLQAQIQEISEEWVADKKIPEMGFTLGGLDELRDPDVRCLLAVDDHHTVHAIASWLPVYRNGGVVGWTLDFMRRRSSGFRPAIEFLIASAMLSLEKEGYEFISLSGAPLARARPDGPQPTTAAPPGTGGLERLLDWLGATLEPIYGFRSLLAFKAKFRPRYEPLYMLYPDAAALPAIGNAVTRAYLPAISLGESLALVRRILLRGKTAASGRVDTASHPCGDRAPRDSGGGRQNRGQQLSPPEQSSGTAPAPQQEERSAHHTSRAPE